MNYDFYGNLPVYHALLYVHKADDFIDVIGASGDNYLDDSFLWFNDVMMAVLEALTQPIIMYSVCDWNKKNDINL